jgi:arabinogalactan endo-1,4-beta-galactosidase
MIKYFTAVIVLFSMLACNSCSESDASPSPEIEEESPQEAPEFYYGADLSYVSEMLDCGAVYKDAAGTAKDPYTIFNEAGANLVRVRLWHNPTWTQYSNYNDVKKTIARAKSEEMNVLLDFHYSDTWADPAKQIIPAAWEPHIKNQEILGGLLYDYTYKTLADLAALDLLPEMVQVGNETNRMILQKEGENAGMDWDRNAFLLNKGIKAVRDISKAKNKEIGVMLHIAQPENALWWFKEATENGITDYDWIGLSYYPIWSDFKLNNVATPFKTLINTYNKRLMVVETAYPFTLENNDPAGNILNKNALINGYPATQQGQLDYMNKLVEVIKSSGGEGLVYWEPAWVSTKCSTLWGQGSHWDNATFFDFDNKATLGMRFYNAGKK